MVQLHDLVYLISQDFLVLKNTTTSNERIYVLDDIISNFSWKLCVVIFWPWSRQFIVCPDSFIFKKIIWSKMFPNGQRIIHCELNCILSCNLQPVNATQIMFAFCRWWESMEPIEEYNDLCFEEVFDSLELNCTIYEGDISLLHIYDEIHQQKL